MKNRRKVAEILSWCACIIILSGLFLGLDSYKRAPIEYGYGPDRREYLSSTLETAGRLQEQGTIELQPEDRWHLLDGWEDELSPAEPPRALAVHRRARFVLPVFQPDAYKIRIHVRPVPPPGRDSWPLELELGVNGVSGGVLRCRRKALCSRYASWHRVSFAATTLFISTASPGVPTPVLGHQSVRSR